MIYDNVNPNNNFVIQRFPYIEIPANFKYFDWNYDFGTTCSFFDIIMDVDLPKRVDVFTYETNIDMYQYNSFTLFLRIDWIYIL